MTNEELFPVDDQVYRFKIPPYQHQLDTWEQTKRNKYWAYLFDMGTGKSKLTIDVAAYLYDEGIIDSFLIFANKGSYGNWFDEHIPEHMPEHIIYEKAIWDAAGGNKNLSTVKSLFMSTKLSLKILIMNIEALSYPRSAEIALSFVKNRQTLSVIDESSTIKNPTAKRTKTAWTVGKLSKARRILTGSIVDNSPMNAWSQYQFLDNGLLGHTSFYSFRAEYAELIEMTTKKRPRPFKVVVGYRNMDKLRTKLIEYGTIVKSEDCLDLPAKVFLPPFYVELTPEQKPHYKALNKRSMTELANREIVSAKIALVKIIRLQQLACGYLKDDDGKIHEFPNNRLKAIDTILEEVRGKVIIWAKHPREIEKIKNHLLNKKDENGTPIYERENILTYYGATSQADRLKAKNAFRRGVESKAKILIANKVGAHGLNLTGITYNIYYEFDYDNEINQQSQKRSHRSGQTEKVFYIYIVAKDTVDEKVYKVLKDKKNMSDMITTSNWKEFF